MAQVPGVNHRAVLRTAIHEKYGGVKGYARRRAEIHGTKIETERRKINKWLQGRKPNLPNDLHQAELVAELGVAPEIFPTPSVRPDQQDEGDVGGALRELADGLLDAAAVARTADKQSAANRRLLDRHGKRLVRLEGQLAELRALVSQDGNNGAQQQRGGGRQ